MKKWQPIPVLLTACLLLSGLTACGGVGGSMQDGETQLVEVVRDDIRVSVSSSGNIEVAQKMNLSFPNGGKVETISVSEGDMVKKGQELAKIETDSLELALSRAEVSCAQANSFLTQFKIALIQAEAGLLQAAVAKSQAEVNLEVVKFDRDCMKEVQDIQDIIDDADYEIMIAEKRMNESSVIENHTIYAYWRDELSSAKIKKIEALQDMAELLGKDGYQSLRVDDVKIKELQVQVAEQALGQANKTCESAELSVQYAGQNVEVAEYSLNLAQRSLSNAQKQLDDASIKAPFDGMVAAINGNEGDYLATASMMAVPFIQFIDPSTFQLVVEVDEMDIPLVEAEQKAIISVDALGDVEFEGRVSAISPLSVSKSGVILYEVEISFIADQNSGLKVGMSATADLVSCERSNAIIVPLPAIQRDAQGNPVVRVFHDDGVELNAVVLGIDDGFRVEVISGLNEGETVVIDAVARSSAKSFF